jgi:hypothetical protein
MKRLATAVLLASALCASAWDLPLVRDTPAPGDFALVEKGKAARLLVDPGEPKVVHMAADQLRADLAEITSVDSGKSPAAATAIIIGGIGSPLVREAAAAGDVDLSKLIGKWESFHIAVIANPLPKTRPEITRAVLVAGSDRRGTAYGVYALSEGSGVSPWTWWADVPPAKRAELHLASTPFHVDPPSVKYRGIFINDEDWGLQPWAAKTFEKTPADIGPKTYQKVFELMLRLRANLLWPAMHPCTKAFNSYPENKQVADDYAIVVGSSHCEPLLRNNVDEWDKQTMGDWNYVTNSAKILSYWDERVSSNAAFESIHTIGMRGIHDGAMPGGGTLDEKARRMEKIIADQRGILGKHLGGNATKVPQIFCPYKEVLQIYQQGMELPDDVTIVWADDNHGFIRQLSEPRERLRSGGSGVYYHLSYWGAPEDYLWLSSISPTLISLEMTKAYHLGADRLWVFNVGDIKPAEKELTFAMELAWDVKRWPAEKASGFTREWAARTFGAASAAEISTLLEEYYQLARSAKPEHIDKVMFPPKESEARLASYRRLASRAEDLGKSIPESLSDAYFQLVLYPICGAALANEKHLLSRRGSGSESAVKAAHEKIQLLTKQYNEKNAGGKWQFMMSSAPRKRPVFGLPRTTASPPIADPILTIPAAGFKDKTDAEPARFVIVPGIGNGAVTTEPVTGPSHGAEDAPVLRFEAELPSGPRVAGIRFLPTHPIHNGRQLRARVSVNGAPAKEFNIEAAEYTSAWKANVLRGYAETNIDFTAAVGGNNTIEVRFLDPGIVLTELVFH